MLESRYGFDGNEHDCVCDLIVKLQVMAGPWSPAGKSTSVKCFLKVNFMVVAVFERGEGSWL